MTMMNKKMTAILIAVIFLNSLKYYLIPSFLRISLGIAFL